MSGRFLLDEHLPGWWRGAILRRQSELEVWRVGDPGAPPVSAPDPTILDWCERNDFVLVTNNRQSMPQHLADHMGGGRHMPGIFVVDPGTDVTDLSEALALIAGASFPDEYRDQIRYLPWS